MSTALSWRLHRPRRDPLSGWIADPRELKVTRAWDSIWIRVVDIVPALEGRKYRTAGSLVFQVTDNQCTWNTGTWQLKIDDTGTGSLSRSDLTPDVHFSPEALGSLYLGGASATQIASGGQLNGKKEAIELTDLLFGWHTEPWCPEVF